jgi:hypothetical protein
MSENDNASQIPITIRNLVFNIVALNVLTLRSLHDGYDKSPQLISKCYEEYEQFLSPREIEIEYSFTQGCGSRFDSEVSDIVTSMDWNDARSYILDMRTSAFYGQLIDICIKRYEMKKAHQDIVRNAIGREISIPSEYRYCKTYQDYVEQLVVHLREVTLDLRNVIDRVKSFADSVQLGFNQRTLTPEYIEPLKLKLRVIQRFYKDARACYDLDVEDLFDSNSDFW